MLDPHYRLLSGTPAPDEYRNLRVLAGLSPKSAEGAVLALPNTFYAVTLRTGLQLVRMGRIVGDGGLTFQLVDIAVHPDHQGQGLGNAIVGNLVPTSARSPHPAPTSASSPMVPRNTLTPRSASR